MTTCGKCKREATQFISVFIDEGVQGSTLAIITSCDDHRAKHDEEMDKDFYTAMSSWCESAEEAERQSIRGPSSLDKGVSGIVYHIKDFISRD